MNNNIYGISIDRKAGGLLVNRVRALFADIDPGLRYSLAVLVTEADGVKLVSRARLVETLTLLGRAREAREAETLGRFDSALALVWADTEVESKLFTIKLSGRHQ